MRTLVTKKGINYSSLMIISHSSYFFIVAQMNEWMLFVFSRVIVIFCDDEAKKLHMKHPHPHLHLFDEEEKEKEREREKRKRDKCI